MSIMLIRMLDLAMLEIRDMLIMHDWRYLMACTNSLSRFSLQTPRTKLHKLISGAIMRDGSHVRRVSARIAICKKNWTKQNLTNHGLCPRHATC